MRVLRVGPVLALVLLLASLAGVVWRQSRALDASRSLARTQSEREAVQAEIALLVERIQFLESRARVQPLSAERMGLRVPGADELVILPRNE